MGEEGGKCGDRRNVEIKMFESGMTVRSMRTFSLFLCLLFYHGRGN